MALLELQGVSRRFGGLQAVADLTLQVPEGELTALIGPNGAGKTTVFNLITGVYRPTGGRILFDGQDLVGLPPAAIVQRGIARTFQSIRLFKGLTALENVRIAHFARVTYGPGAWLSRGRPFREEEEAILAASYQWLERFGLARYALEPAGSLPYGDQRRLEIARAMATRPRLLLLDEPAAGMNPAEVEALMELIRWLQASFQVTIFLIEHQMRMVMGLCQVVHVLDFGRLIASGTPDEVRRHPRVLEAYLGQGAGGS
ncbi:ABC transporter ATP-binding protein [Limnochorda sp.]|uniref:ABC transporter ATP-binding protein n=1 Tax=Limnochorda sp. TaxID=1940279 RepID=UPI001DB096A3|nr:high-affinity branched-chain amino acid ABC transporter ATP-binding protein LivG [Bacillota bacterium]MBO2519522.1 high-affinity branched-chain amino acid ABC transporter ATP-binding protein LivG [Bacillota bacterium]